MTTDKVTKTAADLSPEQIAEIKSQGLSQRAYAKMYGVSRKAIEMIQRDKGYDYTF